MANKRRIISSILCFICGMLIGYATRALYSGSNNHNNDRKKRMVNKNDQKQSDNNVPLTKEMFDYEIRKLYLLLDSIHKQMNIRKTSNDQIDNFDDQQQQELFYDTIESYTPIDNENDECDLDYQQIDEMFENNTISRQYIYDYLKERLDSNQNNAQFLWRLSKATHLLSKTIQQNEAADLRKNLLYESFEYASEALKLNDKDANCHKWYAISIGCLSEFVSIKEKINNGIKFKEHLEIAMKLKDDDATLYHLAGRFCLEMLNISWAERKIASMVYGTLPTVTYEDALQYFQKAYQLKCNWKENILYMVQLMLQQPHQKHDQHHQTMKSYLDQALSIPVTDAEQDIQDKLLKLKDSIS